MIEFQQNPASGRYFRKIPFFSSKKSIKSVKSGQLTPKMAQFEAYIYIFNFQVLKTCHYITNSLKIGLEVTENSGNLAILPPKPSKIGVLFKLYGAVWRSNICPIDLGNVLN